ncbi:MAG: TIM barrel protein [Anaerolineae bacterium]|nr:TIM barrel protein [Anaerolineae bacterium]
MMQELANFSVYSIDTERFGHDWPAIAAYTHNLTAIAGLELLIGYEPLPVIPAGLVRAVHLPFWITWLEVWQRGQVAAERYFPGIEPEALKYYCGGPDRGEIVNTLRQLLVAAASLNPAYAVFHVSHVEPADAFTRRYAYTDLDIVEATVELLNAVAATFPNGEPPVRLFLENLWWPGLTFLSNAPALRLIDGLEFDNWAFVLDTGHLMNTNPEVMTEEQGIDYVLDVIERLAPAVRKRIEGLHFHCSLSGRYQQQCIKAGLPDNFHRLSLDEQLYQSRTNAMHIDQHRPFTRPRCRDIVDAVQPCFLTHEFLSSTQAEYDQKLAVQQAALAGII